MPLVRSVFRTCRLNMRPSCLLSGNLGQSLLHRLIQLYVSWLSSDVLRGTSKFGIGKCFITYLWRYNVKWKRSIKFNNPLQMKETMMKVLSRRWTIFLRLTTSLLVIKPLTQKNRLQWLHDGDKNSAFFHSLHNTHKSKASINIVQVGENFVTLASNIGHHVVEFYKKLFEKDNSLDQDYSLLNNFDWKHIPPDQNLFLTLSKSLRGWSLGKGSGLASKRKS